MTSKTPVSLRSQLQAVHSQPCDLGPIVPFLLPLFPHMYNDRVGQHNLGALPLRALYSLGSKDQLHWVGLVIRKEK